MVWDRRS